MGALHPLYSIYKNLELGNDPIDFTLPVLAQIIFSSPNFNAKIIGSEPYRICLNEMLDHPIIYPDLQITAQARMMWLKNPTLVEAYEKTRGVSPEEDMSISQIVEIVVEGISPQLHGIVLVRECRKAIMNNPEISATIRAWGKNELAHYMEMATVSVLR